ncbi:MAG TPA: alpha/beta hydrolase [Chloroflexota bacterium]
MIRFRELGQGPPMVLVHGDLANGQLAWAAQMSTLARHHRLIVVDRRGHGASPREPRPYTIGGDAADLLWAADPATVERFHLVGQSYGGLVAIEVARRVPERILSLHLIEPPYMALLPDDPEVAELDRHGREIFRTARDTPPEEVAARFVEMLAGSATLERLRGRPIWAALVAEAPRIGWAEFPGDYPAAALADLSLVAPVRVYTGGRSHPILRRLARRLAELIHDAQLVHIAEAGHDVQRAADPFEWALLSVTAAD